MNNGQALKLKEGDRLQCKNAGKYALTLDKIYTFDHLENTRGLLFVHVKEISGGKNGFYPNRFELIKKRNIG